MSFSITHKVVYGCVNDHILEEVCPGGKVGLNGTEMYKEYVNIAVGDRQFVEAKSSVCVLRTVLRT